MKVKKVEKNDIKPRLTAGRYQIEERLGKGGTGTVSRSSFLQSCVSHAKALEPILLSTEVESELQVVGVAVVCRRPGTPSRSNYALYQTVARCLIETNYVLEGR